MNYSPFLISPVCIRGFSNGTIGNIITVYLNFITNGTIGNKVGAKCKNINYIGATSINITYQWYHWETVTHALYLDNQMCPVMYVFCAIMLLSY